MGIDINKIFKNINNKLNNDIFSLETLMELPIEYIRENISLDGIVQYVNTRKQLIHLLELFEVLIYDTQEPQEEIKCVSCGNTPVIQGIKDIETGEIVNETMNGEITHWIRNGKVIHDFICDKCLAKLNVKEEYHNE